MHKISLKDWVILLTIVPTTIISFALAGFYSFNRSIELDNFLNARANSIIEPLAIASQGPLLANDRTRLRSLVSFAHRSQSSIVKSIAIFTVDNQIIVTSAYHSATDNMRLKAGENIVPYTQKEEVNNYLIYRSPIIDENLQYEDKNIFINESQPSSQNSKILGYIAVQIDQSSIKLKQQSQFIFAFLLAFLGSLLSGIFSLKLIHQVAKPVNAMVNAIDRIKEGKLESRVTGTLLGELNLLKNGINTMAQSLGNYQHEMQSSIDQATADLRDSLEQFEIQNVELSIAKKKAQDANKVKSEFLANMSHELRTPLNGVIGFTRQVLKTPLSDPQRDYLQTIDRSANNLLSIINDILDFSKLDAGKMVIESIPFSFRDTINDSLVLLAPSAHKKSIELSINIDANVPDSLLGDAMRIKQIMSNLVSNAIKFTQKGSVEIDISSQIINAKKIVIRTTVKDTGIGMNREQQQTIFNAFAQADQSITRLYGGTGLGLVICQRLADKMNGDIGFTSETNQGSTFWFNFECEINSLLPSDELGTVYLAHKNILYFELHPHTRVSTCNILKAWKMKVTCIESRTQLINTIKELETHNTINYDFALIGHDSAATALGDLKKTISKLKPYISHIHIAINSNSPSLQEALLSSGALSCISKPITSPKLALTLLEKQQTQHDPLKRILPIKVLAVDDNEANLKLINALLLEQVEEVVLAENGMVAYELSKSDVFSLIFMDIQMPIMDGITTLKAIKEDSLNKSTPIIAVTAHALNGEKEKMQQQGFDAYMTKPIDETMLNHIIYEYGQVDNMPTITSFENEEADPRLANTLNIEYNDMNQSIPNKPSILDWSLALERTGGKGELAIEMLKGLRDNIIDNTPAINEAITQMNVVELKRIVHKLNGACCYTGAPNLQKICQEVEAQLKQNSSMNDLEPEFLELLEQMEQTLDAIPTLLAEVETKTD